MKSIIQLIIFNTGKHPKKHPIPHEAIPPTIVEVPQPRNPNMFNIPDIRKKVFAVCNSDGMFFCLS